MIHGLVCRGIRVVNSQIRFLSYQFEIYVPILCIENHRCVYSIHRITSTNKVENIDVGTYIQHDHSYISYVAQTDIQWLCMTGGGSVNKSIQYIECIEQNICPYFSSKVSEIQWQQEHRFIDISLKTMFEDIFVFIVMYLREN